MRTVGIVSRKGGAGKSTLAAHLAVLANTAEVPSLVIDTDPQGSLLWWYGLRKEETPLVVSCESRGLADLLAQAQDEGIAWTFVDSPPHNGAAIAQVIQLSDFTIIPVRPSAFDIHAAAATIDQAKRHRKPFLVVLNATPPRRGSLEAGARTALEALEAPVWDGVVSARAALSYALVTGQAVSEYDPGSFADFEMRQLWTHINEITNLSPTRQQANEQLPIQSAS
jgi:chromosome partitioning protein